MSCNCCSDQDPCETSDGCTWCHESQSWALDNTPTVVDHVSLGTAIKRSIAYDVAISHTCDDHPFVNHVSIDQLESGLNGCVQTTNPFTPVTPNNGGAGDSSKMVFLNGDVEVGVADPFTITGGGGTFFFENRPHGVNDVYGTYFIPPDAWVDALNGTHFSKTCTIEFDCEHFGTPNTTPPKLYRDDTRAGRNDIKFCLGTMDYVSGLGGGDSLQRHRRQATARRTGLCFGEATFAPWTTTGDHLLISGAQVELFSVSCPGATEESNDGSPHVIQETWGTFGKITSADSFVDSDSNSINAYNEIVQPEADRKVWLQLPLQLSRSGLVHANRLLWQFSNRGSSASVPAYIVDTGGTVSDFESGSAIIMTATTTNVTYDESCNFVVEYDLRVQIPVCSFDRTFQGEFTLQRCSGQLGLAPTNSHLHAVGGTARWQVRRGLFFDLAEATDFHDALHGSTTVITSADVSTWSGWVNDFVERGYRSSTWNGSRFVQDDPSNFVASDCYMTGYVNRCVNVEVGGDEPTAGPLLVLAEARYNFNSGAQATLKAGAYGDVTIPHNTTWDVMAESNWEAPVAGDTVELIFDNFGLDSADITNLTFDGDLFSSIDKTTDTVNGFQRVTFTLTVKAGLPASGFFDDTTVTTHDESGNYIVSPFNFTIRQGDGGVVPPPM